MKKTILRLGIIAMVIASLAACNGKPSETDNSGESAPVVELVLDSLQADTAWMVTYPYFNEDMEDSASISISLCYPDPEQSPLLANAVMEWIEESLDMAIDRQQASIDQYVRKYLAQNREEGFENTLNIEMTRVYETPDIVTFALSCYTYSMGAPHGYNSFRGATFRKSDGKVFGWNMFKGRRIDNELAKNGLKEYFGVSSDADLQNTLMMLDSYSVNNLPMPATDPWVEADGVHFVYQSYEIASYADGQPAFTLPLEALKPQLTPAALRLLLK